MFSGPARGLYRSPNQFSRTPQGTLRTADNVDFVAPGVIEPRRGFSESSEFGEAGSLADQIAFYASRVLVAFDFTRISIAPSGGTFFEWAGPFAPVGDNRIRFEGAARSVFFNPADGIRVFDGSTGFDTSTVSTVCRALDYSGGAGDLATSTEIVGSISGAAGDKILTGYSVTAGTVFMTGLTDAFLATDSLTGDAGWTASADSPDYPAIVIGNLSADIAVGRTVAGETSGATGIIAVRYVDGASVALGLRSVVGTFVAAELVAFGTTSLEPTMAGCPEGLNAVSANNAADGWLPFDSSVAYRFTVCRKDAFGRIIEGPPSGRTIHRNLLTSTYLSSGVSRVTNVVYATTDEPHGLTTGDVVIMSPTNGTFIAGPKTVTSTPTSIQFTYAEVAADASMTVSATWSITSGASLSLYLSDDVTTANFLRLYRSVATAAATDTPADELFQVYETPYLIETEINAGVVVVHDVVPESFLEVPLYTNANTGDGSLAANYRPPRALDMVYWQNQMWYLNTTDKHSAQLALIGVGSPDGLQSGDTITFRDPAGTTIASFTADPVPGSATEFRLYESGDPGFNVYVTTKALAQVINDSSVAGVPYAFYVSSEAGAPGKLLLLAREFGDASSFSVYSSRATAWTPQLPSNEAPLWPPLASVDNAHAARLVNSKRGQPEAAPLLNFIQIGDDGEPALRMMPLNYRLVIFKTDGVYYVPDGLPVSVQKLSDHVIIAPDSVMRLGDRLYFLSDQGWAVVSGSGVSLELGVPIQEDTTGLNSSTSIDNLRERTIGLAYRSSNRCMVWTIEKNSVGGYSSDNAQAYVYSTDEEGFTRYTFGVRAAAIDPDSDTMIVAPTDDNKVWLERKTLTDADYVDVGDEPIECTLTFNDFTGGEPAVMKLVQQASFLFRENGVPTIAATFSSEIHPSPIEVDMDGEAWGTVAWGETPWGGYVRSIRRVQPLPVGAANCCQLAVGFTASCDGRKFSFLGVDIDANGDTTANRG